VLQVRARFLGGRAAHISRRAKYNAASSVLAEKKKWVPLDKREGSVKDKDILCRAEAPLALPERLRTKTLEISR